MAIARPLLSSVLLAAAFAWMPAAASAQPRNAPDAVDFALAWSRGSFASPLVCRFADRVQRGLRRVVIASGPRTSEIRVNRVQLLDLGATGAERCHDDLGKDEPNAVGTLHVTHSARRPRSDTPQRDLEQDLERGPLEFSIVRGRLRIGAAPAAPESLPEVDFAGGTMRIGLIASGSDEARRIADVLPGSRQLSFEIEARDGTRFACPLVEIGRR